MRYVLAALLLLTACGTGAPPTLGDMGHDAGKTSTDGGNPIMDPADASMSDAGQAPDAATDSGMVDAGDAGQDAGPTDAGPGCSEPCPSAGATQCAGNGVETCEALADGCLAWGQPVDCGVNQLCQGGQCVDQCPSDGCPNVGATQCTDGGIETCQALANGCDEWSAPASCGPQQICQGDECIDQCSDSCPTVGMTRCALDGSGTVQTCEMQSNGCLEWNAPSACATNQLCIGSNCMEVIRCTGGIDCRQALGSGYCCFTDICGPC